MEGILAEIQVLLRIMKNYLYGAAVFTQTELQQSMGGRSKTTNQKIVEGQLR